jgi:ATP-dependent DNA helicase RecQ
VVFHDSTLTAIAMAPPSSLAELLNVPEVGDSKLRKYGQEAPEMLSAE